MRNRNCLPFAIAFCFATAAIGLDAHSTIAAEPAKLKVLFLGDQGPHRPADRFRDLQPVLAVRGIDVTYTERLADLSATNLAKYDALLVYANIERIEPDQE